MLSLEGKTKSAGSTEWRHNAAGCGIKPVRWNALLPRVRCLLNHLLTVRNNDAGSIEQERRWLEEVLNLMSLDKISIPGSA